MDISNSDADFDAYWEEEARNPNRNRIRIGRQYQATVPPLLKPGESDGRKLEELETLRWKPDNELSDQQLDQYLSVAKAVSLFARAIDSNCNRNSESHCENDSEAAAENATESDSRNDSSAADKNKSDENPDTSASVGDHHIQSALKGLSDFVTSHHPGHHDAGCRVSDPTNRASLSGGDSGNSISGLITGEWTPNEMKLFTRALDVCGKNFGAIKKEFLPWKSVKSIIEHYYLGIDKLLSLKDNPLKEDITCDNIADLSVHCSLSSPSSSTAIGSDAFDSRQYTHLNQKIGDDVSNSESKDTPEDVGSYGCFDMNSVSGQEVKPLKAKPILPSTVQESSGSISTVGSLKFYKDGQLVLKLNAQQEDTGQKCLWIESQDTPKLPRPVKKKSKRLTIDKQESDQNHVLNNHRSLIVNNDEIDDASVESSDDDSLESNESLIVPSPSAVIAKKARVKVENNCLKPIASPNSVSSLSGKDFRNDSVYQCNRSNINCESPFNTIKKEPLNHSPTNNDDDRKRRSAFASNDNGNSTDRKGVTGSLENKWYHTIIEKNQTHPPRAHSASTMGQLNRHMRSDISQSQTPSSSAAIPVDLTRKSMSCSPVDTKSCPSSSSTPNSASNSEKEGKLKLESSSPPQFIFPSYLPLSPIPGQNKIKKDHKSNNFVCQKSDGRPIKSSPPDSPSSLNPSSSQLSWFHNSYVPFMPMYEQYYRYYCTYGVPSNHSPGNDNTPPPMINHYAVNLDEKTLSQKSSSQTPNEKTDRKEERSKCMSEPVFVDGDDGGYSKALVRPDNG